MNDFFDNAVIWFGVGLAFFLLEFVLPGFILFFFGAGAWIVGIITLVFDVSINVQLFVFLGSSVLSVLLFRNWVKHKIGMTPVSREVLQDEFIGKVAKAETPIAPGTNGRVEFKGTLWDAYSDDQIDAGEKVIITGNESIILIVKSTRST
jgi:membrane protein implicated in regulation of membrane protease activity